jgi:hypothetical protein
MNDDDLQANSSDDYELVDDAYFVAHMERIGIGRRDRSPLPSRSSRGIALYPRTFHAAHLPFMTRIDSAQALRDNEIPSTQCIYRQIRDPYLRCCICMEDRRVYEVAQCSTCFGTIVCGHCLWRITKCPTCRKTIV